MVKESLELLSLPGRGRTEVIRLMLTFCQKPFTDTRLTIAQWKIKRKQEGFEEEVKLPLMRIDEKKTFVGVIEIARYIALHYGLYGSSSAEQDDVNVIIDALEELNAQLNPILRATLTKNYEQRKQLWDKFKHSSLIPKLTEYEEIIQTKLFIVGNKISWADIALVETLTRFQACYDSFFLAHFPALKEYCTRFEKLPNMRPYVASRPDAYY